MFSMEINESAAYLLKRLDEAGFEAYLVGGCVRDMLREEKPKDWDLATSATPQQVHGALSDLLIVDTGIKHGTVTVVLDDEHFEITTFRTEGPYLDGRRPSSVSFVGSIHDDLARRDFTINALAFSPSSGLIDPFGGRCDFEQGILRAVGKPSERITEDALRIMRALRFASTLGLDIAPDLAHSIHENRQALSAIAPERIRDELVKLLPGKNILAVLLEYPDVLAVPIPEIKPCVGLDQRSKYHCYNVWEHIAYAVASAVPDPLVRLTLLFHDFGKPERFAIDAAGVGHFYAHEEAGSRIAPARLRELRFDNKTVETVTKLVKWHGTVLRAEDMPRWLNRLGLKGLRQLIEVKRGDMRAHSDINMQERLETLLVVEKALEEYLADEPCFTLATLAINGDDLRGLGLTEGPFIGELLNTLLDAVLDGALENERAVLLSTARSLIINQMSALD